MAHPVVPECVSLAVRCGSVCPGKSTNSSDAPLTLPKTIHISIPKIFSALLALALTLGAASAQTGQGLVPFGTFSGGQYDTVNLANLSIQLHGPIRSKPGLLPLSYGFSVDDFVGIPGGNSSNGPGPIFSMGASGVFGMGVFPASPPVNSGECSGPPDVYWYTYNGFYLLDNVGNFHSVSLNVTVSNGFNGNSGCNATTASAYATDGSGYNLKIVGSTGTATITDVDGNSQSAVVANDGLIYSVGTSDYSYWSNMNNATLTDANGNSMSSTTSLVTGQTFEYQQVFTDSLGQTALTVTGWPHGGDPDVGSGPTTLTWANAGGTSTAAVNTQWALIGTNWTGCSGQPKENEALQILPTSVSFADTSSLSIGWEEATGISWDGNPYYTGRISSVVIPPGATITYAYSGGTDSVNCSDGTPNTITRTTPEGAWTYVHAPGSSPNSTTTITDPIGNQSVYTFSGQYQTLLKVYSGPASGTPLQTVQTCYNNNCSSPPTPPFSQVDTYTTLCPASAGNGESVRPLR